MNKALESTERATLESGDRRIGVVWHTQGSGKSLSMVFYAGRLVISEELENPIIIIITDRNNLDQVRLLRLGYKPGPTDGIFGHSSLR